MIRTLAIVAGLCMANSPHVGRAVDVSEQGATILETAGVQGGLIVHVGCAQGELTAALGAGPKFVVHGLDIHPEHVAAARKHIRQAGLYGRVSVDRFDGEHLPYADNLANLVVLSVADGQSPDAACQVSEEEILRVLRPGGMAFTWGATGVSPVLSSRQRQDRDDALESRILVKPYPKEIDDWTHYLHDASGNAVADDARSGVPRHAQWIAAPRWPRSHEYTPSISALVSSGGRIFYIMDDGPRGLFDSRFPEQWAVYARDAFNGLLLWKRPFSDWGPSQWKASGHWSSPMSLPRRLVSSADRVYVTLGYRTTVSALDATTGEIVEEYEQTKNTDELVLSDGILLARCRKEISDYPQGATAWDVTVRRSGPAELSALPPATMGDETIVAVAPETGKTLWEKPETRIVTLSLAALNGKVCYHTFEHLVCLDLSNGKELWREKCESWPDLTGTGISLVMYGDLVLMTGSQGLIARSVETGEQLWRGPRIPRVAPRQPADLLVADGLLWTSLTPEMPMGTVPKQPNDAERVTGLAVQGLDPQTGQVRRTIDVGQLISVGHHVRCYRSKATQQHLLWPKRGIEFVNIASPSEHMRCDWTRGECSYGVMPANGLLYVPPHPCVCYSGVALNGFNAFAAGRSAKSEAETTEKDNWLEKGAAYGKVRVGSSSSADGSSDTWPMHRHDPARSGASDSVVRVDAQPQWTASIGGRLTQPVVAGGKVLVASTDEHTVYCRDAETGSPCWTFTAGGRIDCSPTLFDGWALFGCRDGWVYCLRAADGALAWRFRAAPEERRIAVRGQIESAWGVHGSVVVVGDTVYFAAGRSSFLDGGIDLFALEPTTGKVLHRAHLDGPWPDVREDQGQPYHMEGAKTDILVSDGTHLTMFHNKFDLELNRIETPARGAGGDRVTGLYLTTTSGFLDDTLHDRFFWFHNRLWPGSHFAVRGPKSGHIMVFNRDTTYGQRAFSRRERLSPKFTPGADGYLLFADHGDTEPLMDRRSGRGTEYQPSKPPKWSAHVPIRALAMALTKDALFLAGPPDIVPSNDPTAALQGRAGAALWAVSTEDGKRLAEWHLPSAPVFDGMSAANGKLFITLEDGTLTCLGSTLSRDP